MGRSNRVLAQLPDAAACDEPELLDELYPRPNDPTMAQAIDQARDEIAQASALLEAGHLAQAEALLELTNTRAETLDHLPVLLEAEALAARVLFERDEIDAGIAAYQRVAWRAQSLRLDDMVATVRTALAVTAAYEWSRPQQEQWLLAEAEAAVERIGRADDHRRLQLGLARGRILSSRGDYDEAIEVLERTAARARQLDEEAMAARLTLTLASARHRLSDNESAQRELLAELERVRTIYGERSPLAGQMHLQLGLIALEEATDDAGSHISIARSIFEQTFGPDSLGVARARFAEVKLAFNRGELERARGLLDRVIRVFDLELGPRHLETAQALDARGTLRFFAGNHRDAMEDWRRALEVKRHVLGPRHEEVGLLISNIAESELALGDAAKALVSFDEALAIIGEALAADHFMPAALTRWREHEVVGGERCRSTTRLPALPSTMPRPASPWPGRSGPETSSERGRWASRHEGISKASGWMIDARQ